MLQSRLSRETEPILKASKSKSTWQAGSLETQERVDATIWAQMQCEGRIPSSLEDLSLFF